MVDDLLGDLFDRDGGRREPGERRGLRGFLGRLLGGGADDDGRTTARRHDDDEDDRAATGRRDDYRRRDRDDPFDRD